MPSIFSNKYLGAITLVLILQAVLFYTASGSERTPIAAPLEAFPTSFAGWQLKGTYPVDDDTRAVLRADDLLSRGYLNPKLHAQADLFVAYFQTQRTGQAPHSPKNCLPGAGYQPEENDQVDVVAGNETIRINHFLVSKGDNRSVVYYWYQSQGRAIAGEFAAKFYLIADSIRKHRSDTALVRIVVPVPPGSGDFSNKVGLDFVQAVYPAVKAYLPQ